MTERVKMRGVLVLMAGLIWTACGGGSVPADSGAAGSAASKAVATAAEPKTVADIFPDAPAKALVLNNCASCHNVACSAMGARTPERWDSLKEAHKERVGDADIDAIFAYLKTNFDSSKPEPKIPPQFLEGGCTPF